MSQWGWQQDTKKMAIVMYMDNSHDTNHVSSVGLHRQEEIIKKLKMQNMR